MSDLVFSADATVGKDGLLRRSKQRPAPMTPAQKAASVVAAATGAISDLVAGRPLTRSPEEVARLEGICRQCEFGAGRKTCALCGCHIRFKATLQRGHCPHPWGDRWQVQQAGEGSAAELHG